MVAGHAVIQDCLSLFFQQIGIQMLPPQQVDAAFQLGALGRYRGGGGLDLRPLLLEHDPGIEAAIAVQGRRLGRLQQQVPGCWSG